MSCPNCLCPSCLLRYRCNPTTQDRFNAKRLRELLQLLLAFFKTDLNFENSELASLSKELHDATTSNNYRQIANSFLMKTLSRYRTKGILTLWMEMRDAFYQSDLLDDDAESLRVDIY